MTTSDSEKPSLPVDVVLGEDLWLSYLEGDRTVELSRAMITDITGASRPGIACWPVTVLRRGTRLRLERVED